MCQFASYYHCACQHIDLQPLQMCGAIKVELARINESQATAGSSSAALNPGPSCVPTFPVPGSGVQGNIVQYYIVKPDEISPVVTAKRTRLEGLRQRAQAALYGQAGPQAQTGVYDQSGPRGPAGPYEQPFQQTPGDRITTWVAAQQESHFQTQITSHNQHPLTVPRPPSPTTAGLCLHCTEAVDSVRAIQLTQPYYGLTENEVMGPETWRFVVESHRMAYELVNNWIDCMSSINPLASRFASLDYPGFPFHLAFPPYTSPPDSGMETIVEELNKEIMMRKMHAMIIQNNEEVRAIKNRYAEEGSAYFENNPDRFISHSPAEDPFADDKLGDVPEVEHPLLYNLRLKGGFTTPKHRVSREVRDNISVRENHTNKSPTPGSRFLHGPSLLDVNMATSMDIDEGTDTDRFTFTDRSTETELTTDIDDDGDTVVYPGSLTEGSLMAMSGTPALTLDTTPSRNTITSISTPSTAARSRKRVRIHPPLPERWRAALRPRQNSRTETMDGLYLD